MIILYSYPELFDIPDNNPFGLKVDTFLRLTQISYTHKHIINTEHAPRGQLPFISDKGTIFSDSNAIISYLSNNYIDLDTLLSEQQRNLHFLITRMLDSHLYWVMSYSRWQDEEFWPLFKAEFLKKLPELSDSLDKIRKYNIEKYHVQGIGRYSKKEIYQSGIDDLQALSLILEDQTYMFGNEIHSLDTCCYGFLANIFYFDIPTPLKAFILKSNLKNYVQSIRKLLDYKVKA